MTDDRELHEAVRAAFACYDQDNNGCIDVTELRHVVTDLGGVLTDRDLRKALRILDRDSNGVIDQDEFTKWWAEQSEDNEAATGEVEKALMRIKELGRKKFRVDIHTASWNGFEDVVERLVENGSQLVNEKDATEFGNSNTPLHYAAYQGHRDVCRALIHNGAGVNTVNDSGCTPIFLAAQQAHVAVVELLLQNGADLRVAEKKARLDRFTDLCEQCLTPVDVCTTPAITELFRSLPGKGLHTAQLSTNKRSTCLIPTVAPAIPVAPALESLSDTELRMQWSAPRAGLDEVVPVSGYKIKLSCVSAPPKLVLTVAFPTEMTINGLCADTEYVATIAAINLHGMSEFSTESHPAKTKQAKPSAPSLHISSTDVTSITLTWALVSSDCRPGVSCVIYLSSPEPDGTCVWESVFQTTDHSTTSTTVEKLIPDHRYKFRVVVISDDGQQAHSPAIAARTACKTANLRSAARKFSEAGSAMGTLASNAKRRESNGCKDVDAE